jgi:hypothetical protein
MTITPKTRFLENTADAARIREISESSMFHRAIESAMLQLQLDLAQKNSEPAANFYRLDGAKQFVDMLMNIGESPKTPATKTNYNLT